MGYMVQSMPVAASSPSSTFNIMEGLGANETNIDGAMNVIMNIQNQKRKYSNENPKNNNKHSIILQDIALSADRSFELNEAPIIESDDEDVGSPNLPNVQSYIMTPGPILDADYVNDDVSSSSDEGVTGGITMEDKDMKFMKGYMGIKQKKNKKKENVELQEQEKPEKEPKKLPKKLTFVG